MSSEQELTPDQRRIPRPVRRKAFAALPATCDTVRAILDLAGREISAAYDLPAEDGAVLDAILSRAFHAIRDKVTHPFRTEQLTLLWRLEKLSQPKETN